MCSAVSSSRSPTAYFPLPEISEEAAQDGAEAKFVPSAMVRSFSDSQLHKKSGVSLDALDKIADKREACCQLLTQWSEFKKTLIEQLKVWLECGNGDRESMLEAIELIEQDQSISRKEIKKSIAHLSAEFNEVRPILLHHAACYNCFALIRPIIHYGGIEANMQDMAGNVPLRWAIANRGLQSIEALLRHGASCDIKNDNGVTPFEFAKRENIEEFFSILERLEKERLDRKEPIEVPF